MQVSCLLTHLHTVYQILYFPLTHLLATSAAGPHVLWLLTKECVHFLCPVFCVSTTTYFQAVATRNLPLCCVLCQCKILRVKNNYRPASGSSLPKSVSGYEVSAGGRLRHSDSSYSVTSASSYGSGRSTASARSAVSGGASWFSIDSLSSFQCVSFDRNLPQPRVREQFYTYTVR